VHVFQERVLHVFQECGMSAHRSLSAQINSGEEPLVAGQVAGATHLAQQGCAMARARGTARRKPLLPRQDVGKRRWLHVRTSYPSPLWSGGDGNGE
jgi:hypothetical protein